MGKAKYVPVKASVGESKLIQRKRWENAGWGSVWAGCVEARGRMSFNRCVNFYQSDLSQTTKLCQTVCRRWAWGAPPPKEECAAIAPTWVRRRSSEWYAPLRARRMDHSRKVANAQSGVRRLKSQAPYSLGSCFYHLRRLASHGSARRRRKTVLAPPPHVRGFRDAALLRTKIGLFPHTLQAIRWRGCRPTVP